MFRVKETNAGTGRCSHNQPGWLLGKAARGAWKRAHVPRLSKGAIRKFVALRDPVELPKPLTANVNSRLRGTFWLFELDQPIFSGFCCQKRNKCDGENVP